MNTMRLIRLLPNQTWAFALGDNIITVGREGEARRFWDSRSDAVQAAKDCGLQVDRRGRITVIKPA